MDIREVVFADFFGAVFLLLHLGIPAYFVVEAKREAEERAVSPAETIVWGLLKALIAGVIGHALWGVIVSILQAKGIDVNSALATFVGLQGNSQNPNTGGWY